MRRNQEFLPTRREQETELSPLVSGGLMSSPMFFNVSPWQMMRRIQEDMDRLFGQFLGSPAGPGGQLATAGQQAGI